MGEILNALIKLKWPNTERIPRCRVVGVGEFTKA